MSEYNYARMPSVDLKDRTWPSTPITQTPVWYAVDLRDGNQALPNPMTPDQKLRYYRLLLDIGFKEIEVGFPAASADDFQFCRNLIEQDMIPDDVTIAVLTQARPHLIEQTIESLRGVKRAILHYYIATSELHSRFVFGLDQDELITTTVDAARQIRALVDSELGDSDIRLEFSPEEFTDTEPQFALDICNAVVDAWGPKEDEKVILNLPATVERRLPNEYADMIEYFTRHRKFKENTLISVHVHNDMGMAVAATMMSLKAGVDRVEGTLFGHGERTGNVDLVTIAMNLEYIGVPTGLNLENLQAISSIVEDITDMAPHPRYPYVGELVFTAFSGSHQDAIGKGLERRQELIDHFDGWKLPYLHVNPEDFGRKYEKYIRINSQSGKGGVAHILQSDYHVKLPRWVQIPLAAVVQEICDKEAREMTGEEVWSLFRSLYVEHDEPFKLINYWPRPADDDPSQIDGEVHVIYKGEKQILNASGNGPISAFVHALRGTGVLPDFRLDLYEEESVGHTADAEAVCFVRLSRGNADDEGQIGIGFGANIDQAAVRAVLSGLNAMLA